MNGYILVLTAIIFSFIGTACSLNTTPSESFEKVSLSVPVLSLEGRANLTGALYSSHCFKAEDSCLVWHLNKEAFDLESLSTPLKREKELSYISPNGNYEITIDKTYSGEPIIEKKKNFSLMISREGLQHFTILKLVKKLPFFLTMQSSFLEAGHPIVSIFYFPVSIRRKLKWEDRPILTLFMMFLKISYIC